MKPIHALPEEEARPADRKKENDEPIETQWDDQSDYLQNDFFTECNI